MAKTTYTGANVAPATDTFAEFIDLTNRITYDMSTVVITTGSVASPNNTNHAETTGNGHVNGYFSSNYLIANTELRGGTTAAQSPDGQGSSPRRDHGRTLATGLRARILQTRFPAKMGPRA